MEKLAEGNPRKLIDLLKERHVFECTGVKLYDKVIARLTTYPELMEGQRVIQYRGLVGTLEKIRNEEQEHVDWLSDQIEWLGAEPRKKTEHAYLVIAESAGLEDVILHTEAPVPALFHALLTAELVDNAGWDLLIALAKEAGDEKALAQFQKRKIEEDEHLMFVRQTLATLTMAEVLPQHVHV